MNKKVNFIVAVLVSLWPIHALAWGTTGHRVIAEIAQNHLKSGARKEIKKLFGQEYLAYWANWPDFIKSDKKWDESSPWHYVNIPSNQSRTIFDEVLEQSSQQNMYKRILLLEDEIKQNNVSIEQRKQDIIFLVHLIGDAHQPLHVGQEEDLGGNKIQVEWFKENTNLHSLWDNKLVDFQKYSYTEFARILDVNNKDQNKKYQKGNLNDWLFESYELSNDIYAHTHEGDKLWYNYDFQYKDKLEKQLLKGGLRLAQVLNSIL